MIAFLSALSRSAFLTYYLVWSLVILVFDIFIIWPVSTELANQSQSRGSPQLWRREDFENYSLR